LLGHLDAPAPGQLVRGLVPVSGWALGPDGRPPRLSFSIDGEPEPLALEWLPRPDVEAALAPRAVIGRVGFTSTLNTTRLTNGRHRLSCIATDGASQHALGSVELDVANGPEVAFYRRIHDEPDAARRKRKLASLVPILRCPACRGTVRDDDGQLECRGCESRFQVLDGAPVLVDGKPRYPVAEEDLETPSSRHQYPFPVLERLEAVAEAGGLALDVGSGRRTFGAEMLVQLEICRYPFTDVISQSDELPFLDETFDFVFSLAVTEHVERPWVLAAEMQRVLKPGGAIVVDSAFLQPLHGYPNHYYNMTHQGLRSLFSNLEIESVAPAHYQHPWFSLRWILQSLGTGLDDAGRRRFHGLTVSELLKALEDRCSGLPSELDALALTEAAIEELAAGFTLIATKPGRR